MKLFNPVLKKTNNVFEGWYIRVLDETQDINYAFIFAKTHYEKDEHAFIQLFDGVKKTNTYLRFPIESYQFKDGTVHIASNTLSVDKLIINHPTLRVDLTIDSHDIQNFKSAMGPLKILPLECYQDVVYMHALVHGRLIVNQTIKDINGTSYMEKTYGRRFPKRWFWLQSHTFKDHKTLRMSLAGGSMPTLKWSKFGFFLIIHYEQKRYRFATYNLAKIKIKETMDAVIFTITKGRYEIILKARQTKTTKLLGPADYGDMILDVFESINASIELTFKENGKTLISDQTNQAGFEWMYKH